MEKTHTIENFNLHTAHDTSNETILLETTSEASADTVSESVSESNRRRTRALEILHSLIQDHGNGQPQGNDRYLYDFKNWLREIETRPLLFIEYTVLLQELKKGTDSKNENELEYRKQSLSLQKKFEETTNLNRRYLSRQDRKDVLFFHAVTRKDPKNFISTVTCLLREYRPTLFDLAAGGALLIGFFSSLHFRELLLGISLGYLLSTFVEYMVHLHIAHASPKNRKRLATWGNIGKDMLRFHFEHSLHHKLVAKNYTTVLPILPMKNLLPSPELVDLQKRTDELILSKGGEDLLRLLKQSQYGLSSSNTLRTMLAFFPISLILLLAVSPLLHLIGIELTLAFLVGFVVFSEMWILTSAIYHPYLHYTEGQLKEHAPPLLHFLLNTRLSRFVSRNHRVHHARGGLVNQNLNLGFDFVQHWTPITCKELIDLELKNVPY